MIEILQAIQILNALLTLGANGVAAASRVGKVLETAQSENRAINATEWDAIMDEADQADVKLAMAIQNASD